MSYKHHLTNHWAGCRLLAETRDHCRNRPVKLYAIPGEFEHVGVTDGTDSWVAPAVAQVFGVDVRNLLGKLRAGEDVKPVVFAARTRIRAAAVPVEPTANLTKRSRVHAVV